MRRRDFFKTSAALAAAAALPGCKSSAQMSGSDDLRLEWRPYTGKLKYTFTIATYSRTETPLVLDVCGHFDAVFGSEPSYAPYFRRAYPWAVYIQVDPPRIHYPISGTRIRESWEENRSWMI